MSTYALERLTSLSTEEILKDIQSDLQAHVAAAEAVPPYIVVDESQDSRSFYIGSNARLCVFKVLNRVGLRYQSVQGFDDFDRPNSQRIELRANYEYDRHGRLRPFALDHPDSLSVTMSSAHTTKRLMHVPWLWEDGGYSLETPEQPSLDQQSIKRLAEFTNEVAGAMLIPVKPHS